MPRFVPRSAITIPTDRQRDAVTAEAIAEMKESFKDVGLINAITLDEVSEGVYTLIAGETRLRTLDSCAMEKMVVTHENAPIPEGMVPVTLWADLTELQRFQIEFHENIKRKGLTFQEEARATQRLANIKAASGVSQRQVIRETKEAMDAFGPAVVRTMAETHQNLLVAQHLNDPEVAKAKSRTEAVKIVARKLQKAADAAKAGEGVTPAGLIHGDAIEELRKFPDGHFDGVVTDPPYGIGITQMSYQNASEQKYDDSYENWQKLMTAWVPELVRVLKPNAAGFAFCDFTRFVELKSYFELHGFEVYPRPFIWDRSPDGRLTTPEKWPRRVYECILFFRRGDRALREVRGDVLRYPADRDTENYHGAKKPEELYVDLMQRIVGPGDNVLDSFAGSGPAVRAARKLAVNLTAIEGDDAYFQLMLRLSAPGPQLEIEEAPF